MRLRDHVMQHPVLPAILLGLLGLGGCGSQPERAANAPAKQVAAATFTSADALVAQVLLRRAADPGNPQIAALTRQAAQEAPARKDIAWLQMQLCQRIPECNAAELETRMRRLDPNNGIAWMGALARAQQQEDTLVVDKILDELSRGKHFNIYWNTLVAKAALALSEQTPPLPDGKKPPDPLTRAMNQIVTLASPVAVQSLQPLADACSATRILKADIAQRCAQVAAALQRSDTYIAEGVGLGIAERLATAGTPSAQKVANRIGIMRYQRDVAGQIMESQLEREKFSRELVKLMVALPREQDVFLAVMRWAGQPLEPAGPLN